MGDARLAVLGEGEVEVALAGWVGCGFTLDKDVGCGMLQVEGDGVPVAQLDRALASGAKGCRFESCLGRHHKPFIHKTLQFFLDDCAALR